jgi:hypothetical protein
MTWTDYLLPAGTFALGALTVLALYIQAGYRTDFLSRLKFVQNLRRFHKGLDKRFTEASTVPRGLSTASPFGVVVWLLAVAYVAPSLWGAFGFNGLFVLTTSVYVAVVATEIVCRRFALHRISGRHTKPGVSPTSVGLYLWAFGIAGYVWIYTLVGLGLGVLFDHSAIVAFQSAAGVAFVVEAAVLSFVVLTFLVNAYRSVVARIVDPWLSTPAGEIVCRVFLTGPKDQGSEVQGRVKELGDTLWVTTANDGWEAQIPWSRIDRIEVKPSPSD